jgi:hypothetical protein
LVGGLRNTEGAALLASALVAGPSKKNGPGWSWLETGDDRTFANIEREEFIKKLVPKGRFEKKMLRDLLVHEKAERADKPLPQDDKTTAFLFIPEYAGSRATADLEEQTVKPKSVYRFAVDPAIANPRFFALLLNTRYGKMLREGVASGATIQRVRVVDLLALELAIPPIGTQDRIGTSSKSCPVAIRPSLSAFSCRCLRPRAHSRFRAACARSSPARRASACRRG